MSTVTQTRARAGIKAVVVPRWRSREGRRAIAFYLFLTPWILGLIFLWVVPLVVGIGMSMTNYDGLNLSSIKFVGFANYTEALSDPDTGWAFSRTLLWNLINLPLWLICSFGLALLLNQSIRARGFFRTLFYLPSILPSVAVVWAWRVILDPNYGLLNGVLSILQPGTALRWFGNSLALQSLSAISVWTGLGAGMVIFLAGLQNIPAELEEAARIDGANRLNVLRYITIPLMTPIIFFQVILGLISGLQAFLIPMLIYGRGGMGSNAAEPIPRNVTLYMVHTYRQIFINQRFGYGAALLWLMFVLILGLTLVVFVSSRYWVYSDSEPSGGK
jgi:multiple sugar transport system permease protein